MNSHLTEDFRALYRLLPESVRQQARQAYELFECNPQHPSLRFRRVHPTRPIYSARVGIDVNLVYHDLNRGNNRAVIFADPEDHEAFLLALAKTQQRYPFRLFGYYLMTNHFHLLLRPAPGQSISRILQSLTVAHTWR